MLRQHVVEDVYINGIIIQKGKDLTSEQVDYIVAVIMEWIKRELQRKESGSMYK